MKFKKKTFSQDNAILDMINYVEQRAFCDGYSNAMFEERVYGSTLDDLYENDTRGEAAHNVARTRGILSAIGLAGGGRFGSSIGSAIEKGKGGKTGKIIGGTLGAAAGAFGGWKLGTHLTEDEMKKAQAAIEAYREMGPEDKKELRDRKLRELDRKQAHEDRMLMMTMMAGK